MRAPIPFYKYLNAWYIPMPFATHSLLFPFWPFGTGFNHLIYQLRDNIRAQDIRPKFLLLQKLQII